MQLKSFSPFVSLAFWSAMPSPAVSAHGTDAAGAQVGLGHEFGSAMQSLLVTAPPSWSLKYCSMPDCNQASGGVCNVRTGQQATPGCQQFGIPGGAVSLLFSSDILGLRVRLFTGDDCTGTARDFWPINPIDCQDFNDGLPWGAESFLVF
ncbi:hypothetical protein TGAM01_v203282 [Trichoderma gamsii]|uniref:Cyanovirin-N domain-containing protein n=1 Tax=Trichoderma gamsii TaxID=398673 RepID=A0A2P4ZV32_9HYPO|nr:hypothetical protein TGAM01_v203282 [Trichoderma gamsii]PON28145.1 hypothetical protein TGAM01_v203282 [Trichoderma gamsii]